MASFSRPAGVSSKLGDGKGSASVKLKLAIWPRFPRFGRSYLNDMSIIALSSLLAVGETQPDPKAQLLGPLGMFVIMGLMFYFALWRPQQKKAREHAALLQALKKGDEVVTSSGICGVIVSIKEKTVCLRSEDAKLEVLKSAVSDVVKRSEAGQV
jgi:preprotein translocase subunit YajC